MHIDRNDLAKQLLPTVRQFGKEHKLPDVELSTILRLAADDIIAIDEHGALRAPPKPTEGLSVRGVQHRVLGYGMKWRGVLFPEDTIVFEESAKTGTVNTAEWLAISDALHWADETRYTGLIYTESYVAKAWIDGSMFGSNTRVSQELSEKIRRVISILKNLPVGQLRYWDRDEWGPSPADYFEQNAMKQYDAGSGGRWKG